MSRFLLEVHIVYTGECTQEYLLRLIEQPMILNSRDDGGAATTTQNDTKVVWERMSSGPWNNKSFTHVFMTYTIYNAIWLRAMITAHLSRLWKTLKHTSASDSLHWTLLEYAHEGRIE